MADDSAPKRRGRPPKPEGERKGGNLTIRTYGNLRAKLEEAARASGRSVSGEIEARLEQSFDLKDVIRQAAEVVAEVALEKEIKKLYANFGSEEFFLAIMTASFSAHSDIELLIKADPRFINWFEDEDGEIYKIVEEEFVNKARTVLRRAARHKRGLTYDGTPRMRPVKDGE